LYESSPAKVGVVNPSPKTITPSIPPPPLRYSTSPSQLLDILACDADVHQTARYSNLLVVQLQPDTCNSNNTIKYTMCTIGVVYLKAYSIPVS
jgi:hypothetical protein